MPLIFWLALVVFIVHGMMRAHVERAAAMRRHPSSRGARNS